MDVYVNVFVSVKGIKWAKWMVLVSYACEIVFFCGTAVLGRNIL